MPDLRPLPSRLASDGLLSTNVFSCTQVAAKFLSECSWLHNP